MTNKDASSVNLITAATATGAGEDQFPNGVEKSFQASGSTSAGAGAATIKVEVSNKITNPTADTDWLTLGTITLVLGTTVTSDGFASSSVWRWYRGNVTAISGTDATVTLAMASIAE